MSPETRFLLGGTWTVSLEFASGMLAAQFEELIARPAPERCDRLLQDLSNAASLVKRARDALLDPDDPLTR